MPTLQRRRMSYNAYRALPESVRAEWVDGEVVVNPAASFEHQRISFRLTRLFHDALPGLVPVEAVSVHLPGDRERIPDITVVDREPETPHITRPPVLVVEILSRSTRSEDTVRKWEDYLAGAIGQYWIVDPANRCIDVFSNAGSDWIRAARADEASPRITVQVGSHGDVEVNLGDVLGDRG